MKEAKTNLGLIKFNRNASAIVGGTFVLIGVGFFTGYIEAEQSIICGTLITSCSSIPFGWSINSHKQIKKIKKM